MMIKIPKNNSNVFLADGYYIILKYIFNLRWEVNGIR
ncbi:MAG: hypothetical protein K0R31_284 [Clostridiales bacterium]|jgi:hypothetical protein|nr:hypothetical protein [Clostridiales bacterium]